MSESTRGSSRRTVLKRAAWTAPAIVIATAAPAVALSGPASVTQSITGTRGTSPGQNMNTIVAFTNANTGAATATVAVTLSTVVPGDGFQNRDPIFVSDNFAFVSRSPATAGSPRTYTFAGTIAGAASNSTTAETELSFTVAMITGSAGTSSVMTTVPAPATVTPNPATGIWA